MVIRGANSDMLASTTLNAMLARRGQLEVVIMPDQHARSRQLAMASREASSLEHRLFDRLMDLLDGFKE
jgi:hypothetical protein